MNVLSRLKANTRILLRPVTRLIRPAPQSHLYPVSRRWGFDRGTPIGRFYIDRFISQHADDIQGDVLEIKSGRYTKCHAKGDGKRDVLDIDTSNQDANIYADLSAADIVPSNTYDCFILTETLQFVFRLEDAARHCYRVLKPGGVLLVSVPTIAPIDNELAEVECWRFTPFSCRSLFEAHFGPANVQVRVYGNFATCIAGLSGAATEELPKEFVDQVDLKYPQGILIRAKKPLVNSKPDSMSNVLHPTGP